MALISKKKLFMDLKQPTEAMNLNPISSMDIIEIEKISANGIFKVGENLYSETFLMEDLNYVTKSYREQLVFFGEWCKVLNSFGAFVKITVFNKNRNMESLRKEILYRRRGDAFDGARSAYNDIIENKIINGKQGIHQVKYLTVTVNRSDYEDAKSFLASVENNLKKEFYNIGSGLIRLNGTERLRILHDFYRRGDEDLFWLDVEEIMDNGFSDWKNDIAPAYYDFRSNPDEIIMDRGVCRSYYINPKTYPNSLSDAFYDELVNINSCSIFTVDYITIPRDVVQKTLEDKLLNVEKTIEKQQQKRNRTRSFSSDISFKVRTDKKELERMLSDVRENDQGMFWCNVTLTLLEDNEKKMNRTESGVKEIMDKYGCELMNYHAWQRQAVNTALPIGVHQIKEYRTMFTQTAAILMPFNVTEIKHSKEPFYYGINQVNKNPIFANRKYDLVNGNGFVFGVPGSGKSFTGSKMEMGSVFLNTSDSIIVIDPTLEYMDVANAFGGSIVNLTTHTDNYFNPLQVDLAKLSKTDENGLIRDKCDFMTSLCQQCMEMEFKPGHKSIVSRCIKHIYERVAQMDVEDRRQVILSDFYNEVRRQPEGLAKDISIALEIFVDGALNIFNHQSNVDVDNRILVFGIRDLGENLYAVSMLVMLEYIKSRIIENFEKGTATWLYVDEFHVLCDKKYSKEYLASLWKTVRKLGGLCTGITQNIIDIMKDKETISLVCNSEYTMFLKQGAPDIKVILENFESMSEAMTKYISNAAKGTGLIRFNNVVIPFDNTIESNSPIYDVFNTNFHEKMAKKRQDAKDEEIESA